MKPARFLIAKLVKENLHFSYLHAVFFGETAVVRRIAEYVTLMSRARFFGWNQNTKAFVDLFTVNARQICCLEITKKWNTP